MADSKISQLTSYSNPISTDILPIVDITNSETKKITIADLKSSLPITTTAINRTLIATDIIVLVDVSSIAITITLPTAVGITGKQYIIKDCVGQASLRNILISPTLSQKIDGANSKTINTNYSSFHLISDGANWIII